VALHQTVEVSLTWKQTVCPAWINMPGEMSFCTTTPEMGERTASSVLMEAPCCSAWSISWAVMPKFAAAADCSGRRLQRRCNPHAAFVILGGHRPAVQHSFMRSMIVLLNRSRCGLAINGDGVGDIGLET